MDRTTKGSARISDFYQVWTGNVVYQQKHVAAAKLASFLLVLLSERSCVLWLFFNAHICYFLLFFPVAESWLSPSEGFSWSV